MSAPKISKIKVLQSRTFHFTEVGNTCTYWSNGNHIVTESGMCRCGRKFVVVEEGVQ